MAFQQREPDGSGEGEREREKKKKGGREGKRKREGKGGRERGAQGLSYFPNFVVWEMRWLFI